MHDGWLCKWPKYEEQAGCCFLPKWAMGWLFLSHSDHVPHAFLTLCRINKPCRVFLFMFVCVCGGGGTISLHSLLKTPRCTVVKMHLVFHPPEWCQPALFCLPPASIQHEGCLVYEWLSHLQYLLQNHVIEIELKELSPPPCQFCVSYCLILFFKWGASDLSYRFEHCFWNMIYLHPSARFSEMALRCFKFQATFAALKECSVIEINWL